MASSKNQSMTEEILEAIKDKTYDRCVSNLTKTHCVNLKKFKRERLPEGTWINTKRFMNNSNRPVPNAMFSLFGEFSSQDGPEVRDTMIGWSYDNFRMLESTFKVALTQRNTNLRSWLNKMADACMPSDELALYILARMYRHHIYVFTQMFWWTMLLYTLPVTEQEFVSQCEIVLVYVKDGVYGELEKIRSPAMKATQSTVPDTVPVGPNIAEGISHETDEQNLTVYMGSELPKVGITESTPTGLRMQISNDVTPQSAHEPSSLNDVLPTPPSTDAPNISETGGVIPENAATTNDDDSLATLLGIDVFLSKMCMIPLVRCDFDLIKQTVETQIKQTKESEMHKEETNTDIPNPTDKVPTSNSSVTTEVHTSSRKRTVIDYKKFLEEFADIPPFPPKKRREVDLKCRPSKSRIAAEKYKKSRFVTKPTNVPKPVCNKKSGGMTVQTPTPSTSTAAETDAQSPQRTITTPAMTQETQDAIDALLLLGTLGVQPNPTMNPDDNEMLMPIGGNNIPVEVVLPENDGATPAEETTKNPKVGTVLGVAVKSDNLNELDAPEPDHQEQTNDGPDPKNNDNVNVDEDHPNSKNKDNKKKTFVM